MSANQRVSIMPVDLSVPPVGASAPRPSTSAPTPASTPAPAPGTSGNGFPNPTFQLDAALGIVVIQFHDAAGAVTNSIPSQRQLDAYRIQGSTDTPKAAAKDDQI